MRAFLCVVELHPHKLKAIEMRVITEIGEQGLIHPDGSEIVFRPSLYAMTRLGSPKRIVEVFAEINEPPRLVVSASFDTQGAKEAAFRVNQRILKDYWRNMLFLSWEVMTACTEQDAAPFIGGPGQRYGSYRMGLVDPEIMLCIARSLLRHGLIGNPDKAAIEKAEQDTGRKGSVEFDAMAFASKAVAHLGVSESEAWDMTITSFGAHWAAKFGENKEKRHSEEHDDTMSWLAAVNKKRNEEKAR